MQRQSSGRRHFCLCAVVCGLIFASSGPVYSQFCCGFMGIPPTLTTQIAARDVALVAKCLANTPDDPELYDRYQAYRTEQAIINQLQKSMHRDESESDSDPFASTNTDAETDDEGESSQGEDPAEDAVMSDVSEADSDEEDIYADALSGTNVFEVKWIAKGPASFTVRQTISFPTDYMSDPGREYLLLGKYVLHGIEWEVLQEVSAEVVRYLQGLPLLEGPSESTLRYGFAFLNSADADVSGDAEQEFREADSLILKQVAGKLPLNQLRRGLDDPKTSESLRGIYGILLGYAGDETDIARLRAHIFQDSEEFRLDLDDLLSGFLFLAGTRGLDELDESLFKRRDLPFSAKYAGFQALKYQQVHGKQRISRERAQQSMRLLFDHPEFTDLVVSQYQDWQDWSLQDQVVQMYGVGDYDTPEIKRAILRYLLSSSRSFAPLTGRPVPEHVARAKQLLDELREKDPTTVSRMERGIVIR